MKDEKKAPKLRFKGFTDDWEQCKFGGIGTFKGGFGFPENEQGNIDGIPFYKVSDMNDCCNALTMKKASNYVTKSQIIKNNWKPFLNKNIIFAKVGAAVYLERKRKAVGPFLLDNNMMVFQPNNANIDYIYYTFQRLQLSKHVQVGTLPSLNASELENITIFIPSLAEQKVVADFGATIDHAITLHEEKQRQLERLKSALLQKMFADENGYPSIRFREFSGEWQLKKFKEVYAKSNEKNTRYGIQKIISVANMHYSKNASIRSVEYLKTYNVFKVGDIAFEGNKSSRFSHGRFVENTIGDGIVSHVFDVFRPIAKHDLQFMKYYINCEYVMGPIMLRVTKGTLSILLCK